jgi:hypothetical protein
MIKQYDKKQFSVEYLFHAKIYIFKIILNILSQRKTFAFYSKTIVILVKCFKQKNDSCSRKTLLADELRMDTGGKDGNKNSGSCCSTI